MRRCAADCGSISRFGSAAFESRTGRKSVAMRGTDGDALASGGAPAAEHGGAGIGLHARPEAVRFRAVAAVGLKCSFGHSDPLLFPKENLQFSCTIEYIAGEFQNPAEEGASRCDKGVERFVVCSRKWHCEALARTARAVHFSNAGNSRAEFHHPWCNSKRSQKTYVNRGLQRSKFVLLSGPFQKFPVKFLCSASRILLSGLGI